MAYCFIINKFISAIFRTMRSCTTIPSIFHQTTIWQNCISALNKLSITKADSPRMIFTSFPPLQHSEHIRSLKLFESNSVFLYRIPILQFPINGIPSIFPCRPSPRICTGIKISVIFIIIRKINFIRISTNRENFILVLLFL